MLAAHTDSASNQGLVDATIAAAAITAGEGGDQTFGLERHLEDFIIDNFTRIFGSRYQLPQNEDEPGGRQFRTDIGPIDILAFDPENNSWVVIELKRGRTSDVVVGQITRYMGWIKRNLCDQEQSVKGLIICTEPDPRLSYSLEIVRDVQVKYYRVSFDLRDEP